MTAQVEILIAEIKDAVTLPVTAVVEKTSGFKCYVKTGSRYEERDLRIGRTNDTYIEILDGVKEGDVVVRNPRAVIPAAREEVSLEERTASRSQFGSNDAATSEAGESPTPAAEEQADAQPAAPPRPNAAQIIQQSDKDGDGKLSKDEAQGPLSENFDAVDGDKDGFISSSEMSAAFSRFRQGAGGDKPGGDAADDGAGGAP
jgi:HlyD family secretion protein